MGDPKQPFNWPRWIALTAISCAAVGFFGWMCGSVIHDANEKGRERIARIMARAERCDAVPGRDFEGCMLRERLRDERGGDD